MATTERTISREDAEALVEILVGMQEVTFGSRAKVAVTVALLPQVGVVE